MIRKWFRKWLGIDALSARIEEDFRARQPADRWYTQRLYELDKKINSIAEGAGLELVRIPAVAAQPASTKYKRKSS